MNTVGILAYFYKSKLIFIMKSSFMKELIYSAQLSLQFYPRQENLL